MGRVREHTMAPEDLQNLWNVFASDPSRDVKHKLMMQYMGLVRYVLNNLSLPTNQILADEDFVQIGILGLHEALERYDFERGVKFETYAIPRIRGKILDEVRRVDFLSRTARKRSQDYLQTADQLRSEYGREVSSDEIRQKLSLSHDEYKLYLRAAAAATSSLSLNDNQTPTTDDDEQVANRLESIPEDESLNPLNLIADEERVEYIGVYLTKLPERQRLIMTLYYYKSLTFKEIGQVLRITESRVCQIHTAIIKDLRKKLKDF